MAEQITPEEAYLAVLAGKTVKLVVGDDPDDPVCLHYLDNKGSYPGPAIYTESISGWSGGSKEPICEPDSSFYVEFVRDNAGLTITDEEPPQKGGW